MIGDFVGFNNIGFGGFLANQTTDQFGSVNWVLMWSKMQAIDAFVFHERFNSKPKHLQYLSQEIVQNFAQDIEKYSKTVSKLRPYSPEVIYECTKDYIDVQNALLDYYVSAFDHASSYSKQMLFFDRRQNKTWEMTKKWFDANALCVKDAITLFDENIVAMKDPKQSFLLVQANITEMFKQGICGP